MKKILAASVIFVLGFSSAIFAGGFSSEEMLMMPASTDRGFYIGAEGGLGITNFKNSIDYVGAKVSKDSGFVGRIFLGYDLCKYFSLEAGYTNFFNKADIKTPDTGVAKEVKVEKTHAVDLLVKLKVPVIEALDAYAKFGGSYLMRKMDKDYTDNGNERNDPIYGVKSRKAFNLAYGLGVDYFIAPNIIANV